MILIFYFCNVLYFLMEINFIERSTTDFTWVTVLFTLAFVLIGITKLIAENRFIDLSGILTSTRYFRVHRENNRLFDWFNTILGVVQVISFTLFGTLIITHFNPNPSESAVLTGKILFLFIAFISIKYILEKITAFTFGIERFHESFSVHRVSFRNLLAMIWLPVSIIWYYNTPITDTLAYLLLFIFFGLYLYGYFMVLQNNQKTIQKKMFYFFLYLCALEIAPFILVYHWVIS
jgi:hypothetical protein